MRRPFISWYIVAGEKRYMYYSRRRLHEELISILAILLKWHDNAGFSSIMIHATPRESKQLEFEL